jgi:hypothetical protein
MDFDVSVSIDRGFYSGVFLVDGKVRLGLRGGLGYKSADLYDRQGARFVNDKMLSSFFYDLMIKAMKNTHKVASLNMTDFGVRKTVQTSIELEVPQKVQVFLRNCYITEINSKTLALENFDF